MVARRKPRTLPMFDIFEPLAAKLGLPVNEVAWGVVRYMEAMAAINPVWPARIVRGFHDDADGTMARKLRELSERHDVVRMFNQKADEIDEAAQTHARETLEKIEKELQEGMRARAYTPALLRLETELRDGPRPPMPGPVPPVPRRK
jgi:hypothetical protein